jgi:hypothetical protein
MSRTRPDQSAATIRWVFAASTLAALLTITFLIMTAMSPIIAWTDMAAYAQVFDAGQVVQLVPVLLLCPVVVVLMASLHTLASGRGRAATLIATVFSANYAAIIGANYVIQLYVVRLNLSAGTGEGLSLLAMPNPHSVFAALEILGYGFFGLAALFAGLGLGGSGIRLWIRRSFLTSGLSGVAAAAAGIAGARVVMLGGFGIALLSFLVAAVLLAVHFRPAASRTIPDRLPSLRSPR